MDNQEEVRIIRSLIDSLIQRADELLNKQISLAQQADEAQQLLNVINREIVEQLARADRLQWPDAPRRSC